MKINLESSGITLNYKQLLESIQPIVHVDVIGDFDESLAKDVYSKLRQIATTNQEIIPIYIDSYGGYVDSLLGIVDFIQALEHDGRKVVTICVGKAMSCGALLFGMGNDRYIGQNSRLMFHRVYGGKGGNVDDMRSSTDEMQRLEQHTFELVSKNIGQEKSWLLDECKKRNADWFLSPKTAKQYNIATHIGVPVPTLNVNLSLELK